MGQMNEKRSKSYNFGRTIENDIEIIRQKNPRILFLGFFIYEP